MVKITESTITMVRKKSAKTSKLQKNAPLLYGALALPINYPILNSATVTFLEYISEIVQKLN